MRRLKMIQVGIVVALIASILSPAPLVAYANDDTTADPEPTEEATGEDAPAAAENSGNENVDSAKESTQADETSAEEQSPADENADQPADESGSDQLASDEGDAGGGEENGETEQLETEEAEAAESETPEAEETQEPEGEATESTDDEETAGETAQSETPEVEETQEPEGEATETADSEDAEGEVVEGEAPEAEETQQPEGEATESTDGEEAAGETTESETPEAEETEVLEETKEPEIETCTCEEGAEDCDCLVEGEEAEGELAGSETPEAEACTCEEGDETCECPEEGESVVDVVKTMNENEMELVDENGKAVPLASQEAADALCSSDPYFTANDGSGDVVGYSSSATCHPSVTECHANETNPIQAAINDNRSTGTTITVEAGVYEEQVVINKNLTLRGSGAGTVIKSPTNLTEKFVTGGGDNYPVVYVHDTDDVTISNLTVDGDNQGDTNYRFIGVGYYNAGGALTGTNVTNIMNSTFSGAQHGVGIYAYNQDGTARTLDVTDNTITNYQKNGMALSGSGLTVNVDGNTVTGQGQTNVTAQNGIQLSYGSTGTVNNNTISGNWYTGGGWHASGVLLYETSGNVDVSNNTITENQDGILNEDGVFTASGNTFKDNESGVYSYSWPTGNTADFTITNNSFVNNDTGVYSEDPNGEIHQNSFEGNTTGVEYYDYHEQGGTLDAKSNWWGSADGPSGEGPGSGDAVSGNVDYGNWQTKDPNAVDGGAPDDDVAAGLTVLFENTIIRIEQNQDNKLYIYYFGADGKVLLETLTPAQYTGVATGTILLNNNYPELNIMLQVTVLGSDQFQVQIYSLADGSLLTDKIITP